MLDAIADWQAEAARGSCTLAAGLSSAQDYAAAGLKICSDLRAARRSNAGRAWGLFWRSAAPGCGAFDLQSGGYAVCPATRIHD